MTRPLAPLASVLAAAALAGCAAPPRAADPEASFRLRLIGERVLEHRQPFGGTVVGGLSGIDRDVATGDFVLVSDDRAPARLYTARLEIEATRFVDATLQRVVELRRPDGRPFTDEESDEVADAEAVRFDPRTGWLWWASEGSRASRAPPFVRASLGDGTFVAEVPLDPMFAWGDRRGPRANRVFEGLALAPDGDALWVAMESPLLEDGPIPDEHRGAWVRFSRHPRAAGGGFGAMDLQLAYPIDPLPVRPLLFPASAVNGVSEILFVDAHTLLVLERSLVVGLGWGARLYEADVVRASDVHGLRSLADASAFVPMTKRLALDFATTGLIVDNLEGVCFGPTLANGNRTLVFVSDDNFNPGEKTQLVAFELVPR